MTNKVSSQKTPLKNTTEFRGWLEQLEAIYMHYYVKHRQAGDKPAEDAQARHWQRYEQGK